ncbi:MAG TPA: glycoside hydrolase family 2 TIM barrel-domain containing protein [Bacteroidales bacterium]|nr:beta-galactosidase [Bacteroidales bacterium]HNR42155.1 glycoside hydrolase family 2 TIM barrel-domain containing protein [Bacteroidales bacterium]HPM88278.1 glycoside hydrolase family 2 TIM barrel-domain containing protein [Bacteroidales bacterium]
MKRLCLIFITLSVLGCGRHRGFNALDLSGEWSFRIDSCDTGVAGKWFSRDFNEKVILPGSMLTNGKGYDVKADDDWTGNFWNRTWFEDESYVKYRNPDDVKISFWLQPLKRFAGVAWYSREIEIPDSWNNGCTRLVLERCHWETSLWIDTVYHGMQNSLATPHTYNLGNLAPGRHRLTLRIDNRVKEINPGLDAHSISDNTQTNWNGVIGEMKLVNLPPVNIEYVRIYPDIENSRIKVLLKLNKIPHNPEEYSVELRVSGRKKVIGKLNEPDKDLLVLDYDMGNNIMLWDEFTPNLYSLNIKLKSKSLTDEKNIVFGMREIATSGGQFTLNGKKVFMRGTLECAIFPKTGFPPATTGEWTKIMRVCKDYGLNHIRFHSWCPPEAAFAAADSAGIYLSVECGVWTSVGDGLPVDKFIYDEAERIIDTYGNHPSFCMMAYGNEPSGSHHIAFLTGFVKHVKQYDDRRLYTTAFGWANVPENDFQSTPDPRIQRWGEGLKSRINSQIPNSTFDWTEIIEKYPQPVISHEIGQWCVFPNLREISKYDGVLKARNFEIFRDRLINNNLLHLADSFMIASGKLQTICYKADIEAALRTENFGGFELLDLHDFPGQGSAIVGIVDPFWDPKPYVSADEFKHFCNAVVPLARLPKMIYRNNETFSADLEIAYYAENDEYITPEWVLTGKTGIIDKGNPAGKIKAGRGTIKAGNVQRKLNDITGPEKLTFTFMAGKYRNSWDIWVYPAELPVIGSRNDIIVTREFNEATAKMLENGASVLLTPRKGLLRPEKGGDIALGFSSIFWNTFWTNHQPPETLGILCNPAHPVFRYFPTEFHSNYQWRDIIMNANVFRLDMISEDIQPLVRVIDDWFTSRPLGLLFECKVGKGKLIASGADLLSDLENRPEAQQFLFSIKSYMLSSDFNPGAEISSGIIKSLYRK